MDVPQDYFSSFKMHSDGAIIWGILVVLFAALVVFTFSDIDIDTEKYEVRQYNKWFGLFKTGKWKSLRTYIGVTLMPITLVNQWPAGRTALPRTKKLIIAFPLKTKPGNLPLP